MGIWIKRFYLKKNFELMLQAYEVLIYTNVRMKFLLFYSIMMLGVIDIATASKELDVGGNQNHF